MSDFGITFSDQQSFNDDVRNRLDRMREQRLRQAVNFGTRYNPVRTGQAAQHGLPFTVSDDILNAAIQQTKQQNIYREVNSYPVSMDFFADPAFASLAADDADNVGMMEGLFKTLGSAGASVVSGALRFIDWERAKTEEWQTQMWMSLREQAIANMTPDERRRFIQAQQQLPSEFRPIEEPMTQKVMRGWEEMAQGLQADARSFWGQTILGESAFSAIQSITQMMALAPLGPAAVMAGFGATEFGSAMQAGEAAGLSPQEAFKTAVAGAFAEVALGFTPVKSLLAGTAGNTLRQTLVNTAKAELATEIPTTLIQSFTQFMEFERPTTSADFVEYAERLPREVAITALSTLFSTGITAPIIYRSQEAVNKQASDIDAAQRNSDVLGQIRDTVSRSRAAANGPALFQKLVAAQAKAYEVREIRIDRQIVEDSLEELGGIEALRKALPEVASKLEAQDPADGTELFIRPEQWAEAVRLNPKFDEVLRQHVRINDQEMTAAEALVAEENKDKFLEELNRLIEDEAELLAETESGRQSIEDDIIERVSGVRPEPTAVEPEVELPEVAEQPQEAPEGAEVAQAIQEAVAAQVPAEAAVEPAAEQQSFDAWFANSQAVDVKGKPLELALRPLQDGEGAFYSEAPAGTGNTLVSIANPLILTGDKASRFIKDAKFRQRTMQKARDLQKDGVIAHGKTQVGDQTVRDSVYAPLDQAQVRTNGRPDPTALEAPRVSDIDAAYMAAVEAGDTETAQRLVDQAIEDSGRTKGTRFTVNGIGLWNNAAVDLSLLSEDEEMEVVELKNYVMQQPKDVPADAVFAFTKEGLEENARLIELLQKAAIGDVEVTEVAGDVDWESRDGQVALLDTVSTDAIVYDDQGNVLPLSKRFGDEDAALYAPEVPSQPAAAYQPKSKRVVKTEADVANVRTGDKVSILGYHFTSALEQNLPKKATDLYPGGPDPSVVSDAGWFGTAVYFSVGDAQYSDERNLHATIRAENVLVSNDIPSVDLKNFGGENLVYNRWGDFDLLKARKLWVDGAVSDLEYAGAILKYFDNSNDAYDKIQDELGYDAVIYRNESSRAMSEQSQIGVYNLDIISDRDFKQDTLLFDITQPSILYAPEVALSKIKGALSSVSESIKNFVAKISGRDKTPNIDKEHAKAAKQGDIEAGAKLTEAAAFAAAPYVFPANHGLREGILREATFDMSMLGVNTRAASAAKGVFASKGRSTASFYAVPPAKKSRTPINERDVNAQLSNVYEKLIRPIKTTTRVGYGAGSQLVEGISGYTTIFSGYSFGQKPIPLPRLLSQYAEYKSRKRDSFNAWFESESPETVVRYLEEERALLVDNATRTRNFAVLRDAAKGLQKIINQINVDYDLKPSDVVATGEGGILNLYVLMNNPLIHDQKGKRGRAINFSRLIDIAKARGHDGLVIQNTFDGSTIDDVYVAFDPGQLKSADPFTYDKSGKLIPLSQRFDVTRPSILYAPEQQPLGPVTNDQLKQQAVIASSMFSNLAAELGIKPKEFWERYGPQFRVDEQARGGSPGAYLPKSMTVVLQSDQTADTLLHELTHHYVHILSVIAAQDTALEDTQTAAGIIRARELFEDLVSEFDTDGFIAGEGYSTGQAWTRLNAEQQARIHERIAYQFGAYLAEDVAPTERVRGAFRKMSDWLRKIYGKTLQKLDEAYFRRFNEHLPALTDDARRIFDRMIGSALAVEQAKAAEGSVPIFQSQEESGMTDEEWARIEAAQEASDQEAIEQMMARFMRDEKWGINSRNRFIRKMQQQVRKKRAEARDRVQAEVERRPVYQAIRFLRTGERLTDQNEFAKIDGKHRLDVAEVKKLFPEAEDRKKLRGGRYGMTMKEGVDPELIASMFGYDSAGAMIQDIIDAKPIKQVVDEEAEALLRKENADLFDQNKIREAAIESIQNERTSRFIALELQFMSAVTTPVRILIAAARAAATQRIGGMTIRELRPDRYANQSKRASKDALKARRAGNNAEALNAKRRQLGLDQMAFVGRATKKKIEQHRKYLRRLAKPAKRKRVGADHGDVIDIVLSRIADGKNPLVVVQPGQVFQKSLGWHSRLMADQGSPSLLDAETDRQPLGWTGEEPATLADEIMSMPLGVDINDMTVEQLEDLVTVVKELEHVGKQLTEGNAASRKQKLADIDEQLADSVMQSIGRKHSRKTEDSWMQDPKRIYEKMSVQHYTMAGKSYVMDGGKYGVWFDYVVNVASQIEDAELAMRADLTRKMSEVLKPVTVRGYRTKRRIDRLDGDYSLMELFVMACNLGNAQNAQRLLNNGYGKWTIDDVRMAIEENLNEQQILAVQKTWDVFSSIKPLIAKLEREDRGVEPTWVQPKPVAFTVGGKTVHLSGGYFPISYDGQASRLGAYTEQSKEAETRDVKSAVVATTHRAFLKNRAREVRDAPLLLSLSGAFASLEEIVHDIHWRQFGKDLNRLLGKNSKTSQAIQEKYGTDWLNDILNWRNRVVSGDMSGTRTALDNVMSWTGRFTSQASLLYNIGSLAIQWTGIFSIGAATGYSNAMYGASRLFNWRDAKAQMMRLSPQMDLRYATRLREFSDLMSQIRGKITLKQKMEIHGYWLLQQAQSVADIAAWHAGFNKALSEGKSERSAADIAYQTVLDTQSSGRLQDLSTVEAGTVGRIFSVFYRPMNAQLNVWMRNAGYKSRARMIADFSAIFMVMPYVQALLKDAIKPDEGEDEEFWTAKNQAALLGAETMKAFLGSFVYVREFSNSIGALFGQEVFSYSGPTRLRLIKDFERLVTQIAQGELDKSLLKAVSTIAGTAGFPSASVNRIIDGVHAVMNDKDVPPWAVITGTQR